jgi:hypothetical protein
MKKSKLIYIVFCHLLIVGAIFFGASCAKAQSISSNEQELAVNFNVYLNDQLVERNDIVYSIYNITKNTKQCIFISQKFTTFFKYDRTYEIEIGCPGYNYKSIGLLTACPNKDHNLTLNFYLYSNSPNENLGIIAYNPKNDKFETYKTP